MGNIVIVDCVIKYLIIYMAIIVISIQMNTESCHSRVESQFSVLIPSDAHESVSIKWIVGHSQ